MTDAAPGLATDDGQGLRPLRTWIGGVEAHVGLGVPDLDEGRRFYCGLLGFREISYMRLAGPDLEHLTGMRGIEADSVLLEVPGGVHLEMQAYEPSGQVGENRLNNQGLTHIAFAVQDVRAEYDRLAAAGVATVFAPRVLRIPGHPMDGRTVAHLRDPWGLTIELMGPTLEDDEG